MSEESEKIETTEASATTPTDGGDPYSKANTDKKLIAGLLGIFLGGFGVHKFYLGYTKEGVIGLIATVVTCGAASIIGLVEGIIYLTKSDKEFVDTYVVGNKPWF